ncbi:MAG: hypothetical protein A2461_01825 [Burkholderiales bacterium RIFOXYC2_FULL_59_8]|nr:MAG: hypothetical protein A2461_01825 [Burkholderiales bacterium RIFOXYC2_FULL_59_8]OGB54133.1 MAG: hypothetical protein A2503_16340 [Burkholderiales bacterium RIFOXYD12_FULL_59_19]OGB67634.1 MAG: hypothetical protein A2496_23965 [Burkholderiales bacterium RIFOXYC12_FULL_60_6]OGB83805.1 MAG: hypothetical protein A2535_11640 [Burkholderiales bacterium RIFOXYD2_FULL_59_8]
MVFITRCCKSLLPNLLLGWLATAVLGLSVALAQTPVGMERPLLRLERADDALWLSTQLQFDLSPAVVDALHKGIPIFFVAEADVLRERWYWINQKVVTAKRQFRLAYQPLTNRWRLNISSGEVVEAALGLALNQNFDTWGEALNTVRRISRWKIADASELAPNGRYLIEFRFRLDLAQLPRPLQIGTLGQSDWSVALASEQVLEGEQGK